MTEGEGASGRMAAFRSVYESRAWLGESASGPGSDAARSAAYRRLVENFIAENSVTSVLDIGCGDWASSQLIDWHGASYLGVDLVRELVAENRQRFARPDIEFRTLDAVTEPLPSVDLVILKEVLQHLPNADIETILAKASASRFVIAVNDVAHRWRRRWIGRDRWHPQPTKNTDIEAGGYRLLALREPPYSVAAEHMLTYRNRFQGASWTKEVLLIRRDR